MTPSYRSMFPSPVPVPELSPGCSSPQLPPSQPARAEVLPPRQVTHSHLHHHRHGDFTALFKILENLLDEERIFKMQSLGRIVPYDSFPVYYPVLSFFFFFFFLLQMLICKIDSFTYTVKPFWRCFNVYNMYKARLHEPELIPCILTFTNTS